MTEFESRFHDLTHYLRQWDQRRRKQEIVDWLPRALLIALAIGLLAAIISRVRPFLTRTEIALLALSLALIAVAIMVIIVVVNRRSLLEQAKFADRCFGLRERATTAVEIQTSRLMTSPELASRQLNDTLNTAETIDTARQMPITSRSRDWLPVVVALAMLGFLLWYPNTQEELLLEQRAVAASIAEQVSELESLADALAADESLTAEQQAALQQPLTEALNALNDDSLSREEAVAILSEAEAEMRALADEFADQSLNETLAAAAPSLAQSEAAGSMGQALSEGDLAEAGAAAAELAEALTNLDQGAQQELAQSLAEAAAGLQTTDESLADALQAAADALAEGDTDAAAQAMEAAAETLQERGQAQAAAAQAQQAAEALEEARQAVVQSSPGAAAAGQQAEDGAAESADTASSEAGSMSGSGTGQQGAQGLADGGDQGNIPGVGGPSQGGGATGNVFVPPAIDLSEVSGVDLELPVECLVNPAACGPAGELLPADSNNPDRLAGSIVPYERVFGIYRTTVNEALTRGTIPLGLQGLVRDYFSSLEP